MRLRASSVRLGRPHQERRDVLGILVERLRRAVGIVDEAVGERRRHADRMAGEIDVVLHARRHRHVGGLRRVALEHADDVVDAELLIRHEDVEHEPREAALVLARLGEHRHVGRQGAAIGEARRLRRSGTAAGNGRPAGPGARTFRPGRWAVLDLVFGRDRRDLGLGEFRPALLAEIAERQQREAVTGLADLVIDLEAALQLAAVVTAERPGERPGIARRRRLLVLLRRGRLRRAEQAGGADGQARAAMRGRRLLALEHRLRDRSSAAASASRSGRAAAAR